MQAAPIRPFPLDAAAHGGGYVDQIAGDASCAQRCYAAESFYTGQSGLMSFAPSWCHLCSTSHAASNTIVVCQKPVYASVGMR